MMRKFTEPLGFAPVDTPDPMLTIDTDDPITKRAGDDLAEDAAQRLAMEEQAATLLGAFFAAQLVRLQAEVAKTQALDSFWRAEQATTLRAVLPLWDTVLAEASAAGAAQMAIGVEWGSVNQAVLKLARAEAARLATQLTDTSKAQAAQIIADWIQDGGTLDELTARLARIYPEARAKLIAATEVTRLYAVGNKAAWDASDVVTGYTWKTARDERVCPMCGALYNQRFDKGDTTVPPAHPGCRCWIVPEVD